MDPDRRSDGDVRFTKWNSRLHPSQLGKGEVAVSNNGRMEVDGSWQVREGYENKAVISLSDTSAATLAGAGEDGALILIGVSGGTDTAAYTSATGLVTVTAAAAHGLPSGHTSTINLAGFTATGSGPDINGNREVTRTSATEFTFTTTTGLGDDTYTSGTIGPFKLSGDVIAIRGSCLFSDPDDSNADYIIIADNTQATAVKISDFSKTTIAYPSGSTLGQQCDLVQEFDNVVLRQEGKTSWYFDPDDGTNGFGGTPAFVAFGTGAATQHSTYSSTGNTAISNGVATVTETAHGLSVGDRVLIVSSEDYDFVEGLEIKIATVPGANSFTYYVDAPDDTSTTITYSTKASLGGGYVNPPGAAFGVYHQRRSWVPYNYDSASTPAHRGIEDEIIASDILSNVYDPIGNQFRVSGGTADHIVALHGFDDDRLLVFNRNSIHYLRGVSGSLGDVETIQLSGEIGCLARESVASYANQVMFLSDQGVYAVSFIDEYNLRGTELPLSEAIQPTIDRITKSAADGAIGVYHDNRYWLAIPIDGSTFNNAIIVYNFLNGGWESLDTVDSPGTGWCIEDLIPARSGKVNELYAVTTYGGLHKLDNTGRQLDYVVETIGSATATARTIPCEVTTRQYKFGDLRRKKFNRVRAKIQSDSGSGSEAEFAAIVEDPDQTVDLGALSAEFTGGVAASETVTFHKRMGNPRGDGVQLRMNNTLGLPKLRSVQIDATGSYESTTSVS